MRVVTINIVLALLVLGLILSILILPKDLIGILLINILGLSSLLLAIHKHDIMMLFNLHKFNKYSNNPLYCYSVPNIDELRYRVFYLNISNHSFKNPTLFTDGHINEPKEYVWFVNKVKITNQYELLQLIDLQINNKAYNTFEIFTKYKKGKQ